MYRALCVWCFYLCVIFLSFFLGRTLKEINLAYSLIKYLLLTQCYFPHLYTLKCYQQLVLPCVSLPEEEEEEEKGEGERKDCLSCHVLTSFSNLQAFYHNIHRQTSSEVSYSTLILECWRIWALGCRYSGVSLALLRNLVNTNQPP